MRVRLAWYEQHFAAQVGVLRHTLALKEGRADSAGLSRDADGWSLHIEGAMGEMSYAKATNRYWNGSVNTFKRDGDVGRIQVRTRSQPTYELIVRPDDRDDDEFVLVRGRSGEYHVVGRIEGRHAKRPEWLKTHGNRSPAYFVPDWALAPIEGVSDA